MNTFAQKALGFVGVGSAARVKRFETALAAADERLARATDELAKAGARFVEDADAARLSEAQRTVREEDATRASILRGLGEAQTTQRAEEAAEAARLEAERQADLVSRAEKLHDEMRDSFRRFIECATSSVEVVTQIHGGKAARFSIESLMAEVTSQASRGAPRVFEVRPLIFGIRMPVPPKVTEVEAELRDVAAAQHRSAAALLVTGN